MVVVELEIVKYDKLNITIVVWSGDKNAFGYLSQDCMASQTGC